MAQEERIQPVAIEEELKNSYLDYAMSVIVSRAIPDVRDGLKPVQRRILYSMAELALRAGTPFKKSARIVGEVMGKYHPHGDDPIYESMVRMAQSFSMRYPLIDGQGNFGSVDNDPPAAMRYTEARLAPIAEELLADIDRDTVDFAPNFDGSLREPIVLPGRAPNMLVNGASGIAVGMATNIPPHNLGEITAALTALADDPDLSTEALLRYVPGPDFPTGGIIQGRDGIGAAFATGRGRIVLRGRVALEEQGRSGRYQLIVSELPFQVNKAALVERIADLVRDKRIDGISDLRDESDRHGMRMVIELKREAQPRQVLNALYKFTALQSAFAVNMLALVDGQPRTLPLKQSLLHYLEFRRQVLRRRAQFDLTKARERAHILEGYRVALDNLDAVIQTIRGSQTAETARTNLMRQFRLSQAQAQAILDLTLRRLAALERKRILDEFAEIIKAIAGLEDLLANPRKIDVLLKEEWEEVAKKHNNPRRTFISEEEAVELTEADMVQHEPVVVTLSRAGYVKRLPAETYRPQLRGGRGVVGLRTRETDDVSHLLVTDTHDSLLFFTHRGRVFHLRCYELHADSTRQSRGTPLVQYLAMEPGERVTALLGLSAFDSDRYLVMATREGEVKKTALQEFASVRSNGLIAMNLESGDELVEVKSTGEADDVLLVTEQGQSVRFGVKGLRAASRTSGGVRGIKLAANDSVIAMNVLDPSSDVLLLSARGVGKRTPTSEFPTQARGGLGVRAMRVSDRTGPLVAARVVKVDQEVMAISAEGIVIRMAVSGISRQGRAAQGVAIMRLDEGDQVVSLALVSERLSDEETPPSRRRRR